MGFGMIGDMLNPQPALNKLKGELKNDTAIFEQVMTPEEKRLAESQMNEYKNLESLSPAVLAQMGYIYDTAISPENQAKIAELQKDVDKLQKSGWMGEGYKNRLQKIKDLQAPSIRPITDVEAQKILPPDQYAIFKAKQEEAQALASGTLPDYVKREMEASNNKMLTAANQRLGPGGYYMSTPGQSTTALVAQNIADTAAKNRERQLGLLSGYYGLSSGIAGELPKFGTGLINTAQSIGKNTYQPFHEWSSQNRQTVSQVRGGLGQAGINATAKVVGDTMGMMGNMMGGMGGK